MGLYETFREPPSEFRQAPFWFWNHRLDRDTLKWQIEQMHDKGIGGFVMHARHGLITPYLSDEWFECIRFGCEKARELGMVAWAYDERDWPSGPAGGEVIADPKNRMSYLRLDMEDVEGPADITPGEGEVLVAAYAAAPGEPLRKLEAPKVPQGPWRVGKAVRIECPPILWFESYLDTLDTDACQAFIRSTYDLHEEKLGDLKALGLAGFFTDEPALSTYPDDLRRIPWTGSLPARFKEIKGYDLMDHLPDLFGTNGVSGQVRYDYWDVAATLFENAFFKALEGWCDARGLSLIGHPLGEEPLFFQFRCLANIFYYLKHFHMPGLDHLTCQVGKGHAGAMSPKMVASAALLAGRERTMTETFGESGWNLSLADMKWMSDWQIAHGINYFIPHAFYYSVAGRRKKDSPPSEFFQAPFWPYYRGFADYTARLTSVTTGGEHGAKVALLYPMSSVWADFVPGEKVPSVVEELERAFAPLGESLLRIHRDFVVVDEASFAGAEVDGKSFVVNGLRFEALVVPKMTAIHENALDALRKVAESCTVVAVSTEPSRMLNAAGLTPQNHVDISRLPNVVVPRDLTDEGLAAAHDSVSPEICIDNAPDVYYLHRRKEGKAIYFLANTAREEVDTVVSLETVGLAEIWNPETGDKETAPGQRVVEGRVELPLHLAAMGSCLIVVDPAQGAVETVACETKVVQRIRLGEDMWHFAPENGNFLALRRWEMTAETRHHVTHLQYSTRFVMPENLGNLRLILDGVPRYPEKVPPAVRAMMGHETQATVRLDGKALTEELPWEIDPNFRVLDMRGRCEPGTHTITIEIQNNGWFPQTPLGEYAWLAGDFRIERMGDGPYLVPIRGIRTGAWEEQGYPCFSGTAGYYTDLELPADLMGKRLFINAGNVRHILEVEVNAERAGARLWPPYRLEVTGLVRPGYNQFSFKVSNTSRNFFEGPDKTTQSGLLDEVWLEVEEQG